MRDTPNMSRLRSWYWAGTGKCLLKLHVNRMPCAMELSSPELQFALAVTQP